MAEVILTNRAKEDIRSIYNYSNHKFGADVANNYINKLEYSLTMIGSQPNLLLEKRSISLHYQLFQSGKHWLVCQKQGDKVYVVTVKHTSLNLFERLNQLKPMLEKEIEVIRKRFPPSRE